MNQEWKPDPRLIEELAKAAIEHPKGRLAVGNRVLSWADLLEEVKAGSTDFAREYHESWMEGIREDKVEKK